MKKFVFPIIVISEWILYFYVIFSVLGFHLVNLANIIYVDTAVEEPIMMTASTKSFFQASLLVFLLSIVCFLYRKFFVGDGLYKRIKGAAWGMLFTINLIASIFYFLIWYGFGGVDLRNTDFILLVLNIFVSILLILQTVLQSKNKPLHSYKS